MTPPQVGSPLRIADTATHIPGGTGNFLSFGTEAGIIIVSGNNAVFTGSGAGGQQRIYGARIRTAALSGAARQGAGGRQEINAASVSIDPPFKIADTATPIPAGTGNFTGFRAVSISESNVAFLGTGAGGQTGIYKLTGGQLHKVISVGEAFKGKTITGLNFSRDGLFGDEVAFQATFSDGSQGVYTIDVPPPSVELRITAAEKIGSNLKLWFTSVAGQTYIIQSRDGLSPGTWIDFPGAPTSGTGGTIEVTLPNVFVQSQQFYRVTFVP